MDKVIELYKVSQGSKRVPMFTTHDEAFKYRLPHYATHSGESFLLDGEYRVHRSKIYRLCNYSEGRGYTSRWIVIEDELLEAVEIIIKGEAFESTLIKARLRIDSLEGESTRKLERIRSLKNQLDIFKSYPWYKRVYCALKNKL
jgi:hypothetical protein